MKYIEPHADLIIDVDVPIIELSRRNLLALLEKLDDPTSACTLGDPDEKVYVRAVEDSQHYKTRAPGANFTNGVLK